MAPAKQDTAVASIGQEQFQESIRAQMREAVRLALLTVLEEEVTVLIGANPYEPTALRRDHLIVTNAGGRKSIRPSAKCSSVA